MKEELDKELSIFRWFLTNEKKIDNSFSNSSFILLLLL